MLPIAVDYVLRDNIYYAGGLVENIVYIAISNALIPPMLKILDPMDFYTRLKRWYYNRPSKYFLI
jgi:hypothetical protein